MKLSTIIQDLKFDLSIKRAHTELNEWFDGLRLEQKKEIREKYSEFNKTY